METPRRIRYVDVVETVRISSEALAAIRAHAASDADREVCGLLFGETGQINAVKAAANMAANPSCAFEIDAADLFAAARTERAGGPKLVGNYHSHPNGSAEPSATDRENALETGRLWLIAANGTVGAWRATPEGLEQVELVIDPLPPDSVSATRPS